MTGWVPAEAVRVARLAERRKAGPLGFAGAACLAVIVMINQAPCAALSNRLAASADSRTSPECRPNAEGASTAVSGSRILRHSRYFRQRALWSLEIVPPIGWVSWRIRTVTLVALPESPHRGAGARPGGEPGGRDGRYWPHPFGLGSTMHRAGTRPGRATCRQYITTVH